MKDEEYYQFTNSCYIKKASNNKTPNETSRLKAKERSLILKEKALKTMELRLKEKEKELELREKEINKIKKDLNIE